jgi:phage-related protein
VADPIEQTNVDMSDETVNEQASHVSAAFSETARRYLMATLGALAVAGDNVATVVDSTVGPTVDKLVERGQALEQERLQPVTKAAQQTAGAAKNVVSPVITPVIDAASSAGRQATSAVSSGATQVRGAASGAASSLSELARKQAKVASTSALTALLSQIDALQSNLTQIRNSLAAEIESREHEAAEVTEVVEEIAAE